VEYTPQPDDLVLRLDPGRAFGTGQHASTALVAAQLERFVRRDAPVLDVGCGSGILSFVALALGAPSAIACDVDPDAVASTKENATLLGFADRIDARVGGIEAIPETSSLVLANIEAAVLIPMAASLAPRVAKGGVLILSGILSDQSERVRAAYEAAGLVARDQTDRDGWVAPCFERAR
jgi:ribosomal protein L11 methyltransferase